MSELFIPDDCWGIIKEYMVLKEYYIPKYFPSPKLFKPFKISLKQGYTKHIFKFIERIYNVVKIIHTYINEYGRTNTYLFCKMKAIR